MLPNPEEPHAGPHHHGLRDFFLYQDMGVADATHGNVLVQRVKANEAPEKGTGWHRHEAAFHVVIMTKGWATFMYGDQETRVEAGDCVHQQPGIVHYLFDYSPDMEYIEIVSPADFANRRRSRALRGAAAPRAGESNLAPSQAGAADGLCRPPASPP
jgi:quercetin dioxygenase-like cupin family protein